jgi:hypothetical protein
VCYKHFRIYTQEDPEDDSPYPFYGEEEEEDEEEED